MKTSMKLIEVRNLLEEIMTRSRDLMKDGCERCFDVLEQVGKLNKKETLAAVRTAADSICEKMLDEIGDRFGWTFRSR